MTTFERCLWGAFGGITPILAALVATKGHPFTTYFLAGLTPTVLRELVESVFLIAVLLAIGAAWAHMNKASDALKAFQFGVAAPAVIVGIVASNDARKAKEYDPQLTHPPTISAQVSSMNSNIVSASTFVVPNFSERPMQILYESVPLNELPNLFSGVERRLASDRLIALYPNNKKAVVEALIAAIQPGNLSTSYRINIYVARTLRLIQGKWEGTEAQRAAVAALKDQQANYKDPTFKENVDAAWDNWKPISSN